MKRNKSNSPRKPNPMARDLMDRKYFKRIVESKKAYSRKTKHKKKET